MRSEVALYLIAGGDHSKVGPCGGTIVQRHQALPSSPRRGSSRREGICSRRHCSWIPVTPELQGTKLLGEKLGVEERIAKFIELRLVNAVDPLGRTSLCHSVSLADPRRHRCRQLALLTRARRPATIRLPRLPTKKRRPTASRTAGRVRRCSMPAASSASKTERALQCPASDQFAASLSADVCWPCV